MRISSYSKLLDAYLVVRCTDSIADTLNVLDTNGQNFVVVVDTTQKLFGIIYIVSRDKKLFSLLY